MGVRKVALVQVRLDQVEEALRRTNALALSASTSREASPEPGALSRPGTGDSLSDKLERKLMIRAQRDLSKVSQSVPVDLALPVAASCTDFPSLRFAAVRHPAVDVSHALRGVCSTDARRYHGADELSDVGNRIGSSERSSPSRCAYADHAAVLTLLNPSPAN